MKIQKTIYLVRHGATEYNDRDILQGQIDLPLSNIGIKESELLSARFEHESFDIIFHSPLIRAFLTAEIVNRHHHLNYIPIQNFKEIDLGEWEGKPYKDVVRDHSTDYRHWLEDPSFPIPGGESYADVQHRTAEGVNGILKSDYENILIFAHAAVNRGILGNFLNIPPSGSRRFRMDNCGYSKFIVYQKPGSESDLYHVVLDKWNVTDHLEILK